MAGSNDLTTLSADETHGLGPLEIRYPPGTFALTPASLIAIEAIGRHQELLRGTGLDWGSGTGCLAIAAARISAVEKVIGLEISPADVAIARENARRNAVEGKVEFLVSDSYAPLSGSDREKLESLGVKVSFILANPPAAGHGDAFEWRRQVLRGATPYLRRGGVVFLNISSQYGPARIEGLMEDAPGFVHEGVLASTGWVPFDLRRQDLLDCLQQYVREEGRGGSEYAFGDPGAPEEKSLNARAAMENFDRTQRSPLTRWQVRLFRFMPG